MAIVFEPFVYEPTNYGTGGGSVRALGSKGSDLTDFGIAILRPLRTRTLTRGVYKQGADGVGSGSVGALTNYGFETGDTFGVAIIRGIARTFGVDTELDALQNGVGSGALGVSMSSTAAGFEKVQFAAVNKLQRVRAYGQEPAGDYGIAVLSPFSSNTAVYTPPAVYMGLLQHPGYINVFAETEFSAVTESLTLAETTAYDLVYAAIERLAVSASPLALGSYLRQLDDRLSMHDRLQSVYDALLTELVIVDDDILGSVVKTVALLDTLRLRDTPAGLRSALSTVVEAMTLASVARSVLDEQLDDVVLAQTALETRSAAIAHLLETMLTSDVLAGLAVFTVDAADELVAADSVLTAMTLHAMIEDGLRVAVGLTLDGVPYTAMVLHTDTMGVTEYAPYDFNSLATFGGVTYGAGPSGLYRLTGADDAGVPIDAFARTALARIANGRQAQVDSAYLGYSADGAMQLKAIVTEPDGSKTARVYQLKAKDSDAIHAGRIKLGKGVKSAYWAFEISNVLGSDFTIDVIELHALALSRRV